MKPATIKAKIKAVGGPRLALRMLAAKRSIESLVIERLLAPEVGREYGVTRQQKKRLANQIRRNVRIIPSATMWVSHIALVEAVLRIPKSVKGDIIECGCYKGASTASLSLACKLTGRKLIVADSFEGLPAESEGTLHIYSHLKQQGIYEEGAYSGTLAEVKANISLGGDISVCTFVTGFYSSSLKNFKRPIALAFLDVDLESSIKDCIKAIWPTLANGGYVYTDDSCDMEVVKVWFDNQWWRKELQEPAPGYVGSGCGLPIDISHSGLGYTQKVINPHKQYSSVTLHEEKSKGAL